MNRLRQDEKTKIAEKLKLPEMDARYREGIKRLKEMTKFGNHEPVIPAYHYMSEEDKIEYYCPLDSISQVS